MRGRRKIASRFLQQMKMQNQKYMQRQKERPENDELCVPRLMAEQCHAEKHAGAAADGRRAEQRCFGDAPHVPPRKIFVQTHKYERERID